MLYIVSTHSIIITSYPLCWVIKNLCMYPRLFFNCYIHNTNYLYCLLNFSNYRCTSLISCDPIQRTKTKTRTYYSLYQQPEISWIMFNQAVFLSQVNFVPEGLKEHQNISWSTNTGVVPLSILASLFPKLVCDMICQFLCHLEFCHEITDSEILALLHAKASRSQTFTRYGAIMLSQDYSCSNNTLI